MTDDPRTEGCECGRTPDPGVCGGCSFGSGGHCRCVERCGNHVPTTRPLPTEAGDVEFSERRAAWTVFRDEFHEPLMDDSATYLAFIEGWEAARQAVANADAELASLRRWKIEATEVIRQWDKVWGALGRPGRIGTSKSEGVLAEVERVKAEARRTALVEAADDVPMDCYDPRHVQTWLRDRAEGSS